jgi:catechol 2,3-dioxygenase-like lactoylglutathione lyase family enzyme
MSTLSSARISGRLPAQDLGRARRFYAEVLGLEPVEERPGGLRYEGASGSFSLFESSGRPSGEHTQLAFSVDDLDATVAELQARGVSFDEFGIVEVEGNYPSTGATGERAAWFRDSEGNLIGLGQAI